MVLRARWILGGGVAADRTVDDEGTDEDGAVLLLGPQTLILALPDAEDGDDMTELGDFTLLPVNGGNYFLIVSLRQLFFENVDEYFAILDTTHSF